MKYNTPELTALTPAINAIQTELGLPKTVAGIADHPYINEHIPSYADWE
jgi:hypothetical protein